MKNAKRIVSIFLLIFLTGGLLSGQSLERYEGILKKRGPVSQLKDKFYQPSAQSGYYTPAPAQRTCATMESEAQLRADFPEMGTLDEFEAQLQEKITEYESRIEGRDPENVVITIPVIVHVVHNGEGVGSGPNISQSQILSQIDALNEDYRRSGAGANNHPAGADVEIEFALAVVDPQGVPLPEPGIDRINGGRAWWDVNTCNTILKPNTIWDPNRYCNMWTVQFGGEDDGLLGYAQFPSLSGLAGLQQNEGPAGRDGVVIRWQSFGRTGAVQPPYNQGRTATHEIGHWLGLRHIWGDGGCGVDDFCADTPTAGQPNYSCINVNSCGSASGDMIENYMDYTNDACMNIFTNNQKTRIRTVMDNSPRRQQLKNSTVHIGGGGNPGAPVAIFSANKQNACAGQTIQFSDQSTNNPNFWEWQFFDEDGNLLATFNGANQSITFNEPGIYSVQLTVSNASGSSSQLEENYIAILSSTVYSQLIEDIEDPNMALQDWVWFNPDDDRTFELGEVSSYGVGNYSIAFDNYSTFDDPSGTVDALISPPMDLSGMANPYFYFEHAYAQFNTEYSDTLLLFYSLDCGNTFQPFWFQGGADLATAAPTQSAFVPNSNQWDWNQISLGFLAGQPSVHLLVANLSGWGNYLYLDQLSIVDAFDFTNGAVSPDFGTARTTICAGEIIQFEDYSSNFPFQWNWQFEGGNPSSTNVQHPFVQYNFPGVFDVGLSAVNTFGGNTVTASNFIEVVPLPQVEVFADQLPVCGGQAVTLTATGASTYQWFDERSGSLIFEGASITVTLFEDWQFSVVGRNQLGCEKEVVFQLEVSAPSTPTISQQGDLLVASAGSAYQWYFEGEPIPASQGGAGPSIQPFASGFFQVEVFDQNGCSAISDPFEFDLMSATGEPEDISASLLVFPNPTDRILQLQLNNELHGTFQVKLSNALGQQLQHEVWQKGPGSLDRTMDLTGLPDGIYFLTVENEDYRAMRRIVKGGK